MTLSPPIVVGRDLQDVHANLSREDLVDEPILCTQAGGAIPLPLASQGLIMQTLDQPETAGPRNPDDVLPLLITFQNLNWESVELATKALVLVDLPHTINILYHVRYVKR
jgi:hypothetical protein